MTFILYVLLGFAWAQPEINTLAPTYSDPDLAEWRWWYTDLYLREHSSPNSGCLEDAYATHLLDPELRSRSHPPDWDKQADLGCDSRLRGKI